MPQKKLIKYLGFYPKENTSGIFQKKYSKCDDYVIEVDFEKDIFIFGNKIKAESKTTQNFSQAENWVVLECIDRLLEKGYQPQNITLEKTWKTGHGTSGRLDILVTRDDGSTYLMIECKTWGIEFEKEFKNLEKNGGQLFTYFQQDKNAEVLMLYASEYGERKIKYRNEIVKIEEDYRQAGNVKDFFERWNKLPKSNGVFDNWCTPYNYESKALTPNDLSEITQKDSSKIFNRFLEILRHNVVSDKGNAFNKIFTLFLCKIYDEKVTNPNDELKFQWLEGRDDDVDFQKRLTDLYKKGMNEFLSKEVTDLSDEDFETKYGYLIDNEEAKRALLKEFTKIRLQKNNEFAIKEVFDADSFEENAKVVKEVVELLQGFKIRYTKKQQYLSDFFELLLTTGLKQESGQFFTPVPIAQFVIKSIPLDKIVTQKLKEGKRDNLLPTIIDYASGSGHFLTESMHEIQKIISKVDVDNFIPDIKNKIDAWNANHFDWAFEYIYGIEKDYRLVKVGKVGCYLHGDGLAKVIHSDGLGNFTKTKEYQGKLAQSNDAFPKENNQFDIVVSNPPYSVSSFRNNARKYYTNEDFELYDYLTDNSSEIECLFIERTKQLLKKDGLAGIILPSSILSNTGIYSKTREIILQYFDIVGIAELGSNTFMATGTNTVILFLRRRDNYFIEKLKVQVANVLKNKKDVTVNGIENPISKYIAHVWEDISFNDYKTLLKKSPNVNIKQHEIYQEYSKKIKAKNEQEKWNNILALEQDKILYFILASPQKLVLVKTGEKNKEKQFLGYEFSNRRGSEGIHPVQRSKSIDECTQLYDANTFENPEKASTYIYKAFKGEFDLDLPKNLKQNISYQNLVDMLTFDRVDFEKNISLSAKKKVRIKSKWDIVKIGQIASTQYGFTDKAVDEGDFRYLRITDLRSDGSIDTSNEAKFVNPNETTKKQFLLKNNDVVIARSGSVGKSAIYKSKKYEEMIFASYLIRLQANIDKVFPDYLFSFTQTKMYWNQVEANSIAVTQPNLNAEKIKEFKIPLPPKDIQEKIVSKIEILEKEEKEAVEEIQKQKQSIVSNFIELKYQAILLGDITSFKNGLNYNRQSLGELITIVGVGDFKDDFSPEIEKLEKTQIDGELNEDYELKPKDILVVRSNGSARLVGRFLYINKLKDKTSFSGFTIRIRVNSKSVDSKFLCHYLKTDFVRNNLTKDSKGSNIKSLNQGLLSSIKVPLPPIKEQQKIVSKIEKLEKQITDLESQIELIPNKKELILKKYLE